MSTVIHVVPRQMTQALEIGLEYPLLSLSYQLEVLGVEKVDEGEGKFKETESK